MVEFDPLTTAIAFLAIVAVSVGGLLAAGFMHAETVLMMVAPSMLVFGGLCLAIGVQFGEYRATQS